MPSRSGRSCSSDWFAEVATFRAPISIAPSQTEFPLSRRSTRWRPLRDTEPFIDQESPEAKLVPHQYTLPRLIPATNSVDTSERPREILIALQSWEGVVLDVDDTSFVARLIDVAGEHDDEEVKLSRVAERLRSRVTRARRHPLLDDRIPAADPWVSGTRVSDSTSPGACVDRASTRRGARARHRPRA